MLLIHTSETFFFHIVLSRDQDFAGSVLLEREGNGNALTVFIVKDRAPLLARQALGMYGKGCDQHQHPSEN